tara:strand:+ start:128 stop:1372 length:1245 start_codon:yes stop_codon:yes gene_type:complete
MSDLKTFLHKNGKVLTILYIILIIIVLLLILDETTLGRIIKHEGFVGKTTQALQNTNPSTTESSSLPSIPKTKKDSKIIIHNLLLTAINKDIEFGDPNKKYVGSFISLDNTTNNKDNFVVTNDIESDRWTNNENSSLSDKHVVMDLTYDTNKRLMAIGMKMVDGEPHYEIFQKETDDINSKWVRLESNGKIRSLCYDLKHSKMIGCNSYDGQIYECKFNLSFSDWVGPINYDLPMRKVMYDKEGFMIGIGLIDNYIYKKTEADWRLSKWDKKTINKTKVYDLIYDRDGCLIATTAKGIMKQENPDFTSEFIPYNTHPNTIPDDGLSNAEILKYRIGYEYLDDDFDMNTELGRDLKRLYEFKKISKDLCAKRGGFIKQKINSQENSVSIDDLGNQNKVINDLYTQIDELTNKLDI